MAFAPSPLTPSGTLDLYPFDRARRLVDRGQFDDRRPGYGRPATDTDLRAAYDAILAGGNPATRQLPSIGCSTKWTPGNEPDDHE